jgi:heat shock protein HtpX
MHDWVPSGPRHVPSRAWALRDSLKSAALLAALAGLAALVGYTILGGVGLALGAAAVGLLAAAGATVSEPLVMRLQGAVPMAAWQAPGLSAMVSRLASRAGIEVPELYLAPSSAANAMALRTRRGPGALAVTRGALRLLRSDELEAVIAHEIAHLHNGDTEILRVTGLVSRATSSLLRVATWIAVFTVLLTGGGLAQAAALSLLAITVPVAVGTIRTALSRTREHAADTTAVALTGRPRALASALVTLERQQQGWLGAAPLELPSWLRSHPPTEERVARLLAMAPKA